MARGFESKDVEYQQAEAERARMPGRGLTPAQRAAGTARTTVELALARKRAELDSARSEAHRRMLTAAIEALELELKRLA